MIESANITNSEDIDMAMNETRGHKRKANERTNKIRKLEEFSISSLSCTMLFQGVPVFSGHI